MLALKEVERNCPGLQFLSLNFCFRMLPPVVFNSFRRHTATLIFLHGLGDDGIGWGQVSLSLKDYKAKRHEAVCNHKHYASCMRRLNLENDTGLGRGREGH